MKHQHSAPPIVDPRPLLAEARTDSPLWVLADSFDAVANGMKNPEADEKLALVQEPRIEPWKQLVTAISALYADDTEACLEASRRIDGESPPAALVPLFQAWAGSSESLKTASAAVAILYRRVIADVHPLEILAEQAEEALRHGMIERFESSSRKVLQSLAEMPRADGSLLAMRWAVRCLVLLNEADVDDLQFMETLAKTIGRADSLLASGLALLEVDEDGAASVFRSALECGEDGHFLHGSMRPALAEAVDALSGQRQPSRIRPQRHSIQLDLFSGAEA